MAQRSVGRPEDGRAPALAGLLTLDDANACIRDLIAISTLPAMWMGSPPGRIAESLLAVIESTVEPALSFIRIDLQLREHAPTELALSAGRPLNATLTAALGARLTSWLAEHDADDVLVLDDLPNGQALHVCVYPLGHNADNGLLAVGFEIDREGGSPLSELHRMLLNVAANQTNTACRNFALKVQADEARRDAEAMYERLQRAQRAAHLGTWDWDFVTDRVTWSDGMYELVGLEPGGITITPERWLGFVVHEDQGTLKSLVAQMRRPGQRDFTTEFRIRRADGAERWFASMGRIQYGPDGAARRMMGVNIDITDRKRVEDSLRVSEARLQMAQRAARLGIHDYDITNDVLDWDARVRELWGVTETEPITYDTWLSGLHPDDRDAAIAEVERALEPPGMGTYKSVYRVVHRIDGITRWIEAAGQVTFSRGQPVRLVGTVEDISEQKLAEQALRDSDRRKDEFLATLAHELRNPLAPIGMAVRILRVSREDSAQFDKMASIIERQSMHLVRLIDDLLDVSRITRGKIALQRERIDFASVVAQAVDGVRPVCDEHGQTLTLTLPEQPLPLDADPVRIGQIVSNLLNNACKFTGPQGTIDVQVDANQSFAAVRIRDSGVGIAQDQLGRIFEMFAQIEDGSGGRASGGLGIGLSLARSLAELHGGTITAHSEGPGMGSEFELRLPLASADTRTALIADGMHKDSEPKPVRRRIVAVDDNEDALVSVATLLQLRGHDVVTAPDGEQAMACVASARPDVVLLDIGLPGMDGYQVARRIRALPYGENVLLVAMTGWGQAGDKRKAVEAGFDAHLTKPVDPEVLERVLAGESVTEVARDVTPSVSQ